MWTWTDPTDRNRGARRLLAGVVALLLLAAPAALVAAEEGDQAEAMAASDLRAAVMERYEPTGTVNGILLEPRTAVPGVQTIEVRPGEVEINGEAVSPTILRSWFGDEAEVLLQLAAVDGDEARELLAVASAAEAEEAAQAAEDAAAAAEEEAAETGEEGTEDEMPSAPEPPEAPEAPALPETPTIRTGSLFKVGSDVVVERDEVATEVMVIGGSVRVEGRVRRDVVAIGGRVEVVGEVGNEVVAIGGGVELGPEARVDNNVLSVGGSVIRAPGAEVGGEVTRIGLGGVGGADVDWEDWTRHGDRSPFRAHRLASAYWNLVGTVLLALLVCLSLLVARGPVQSTARRFNNLGDVLLSALVGLLGAVLILVLLPVLTLLLIASVVGCLLVPLVFFVLPVLLVIALFGYAAAALRLGRWVGQRFGWNLESSYVAALVGVGCIEVWTLVGKTLSVLSGPVWFFAMLFLVFGFVVELVAWLAGFGGILMHFIEGRRNRGTVPAGTPLPPAAPVSGGEAAAAAQRPSTPAAEPERPAPAEPAPPAPEPPPVPESEEPKGEEPESDDRE